MVTRCWFVLKKNFSLHLFKEDLLSTMEVSVHVSSRTLISSYWIPQNELWCNMQTTKMQVGLITKNTVGTKSTETPMATSSNVPIVMGFRSWGPPCLLWPSFIYLSPRHTYPQVYKLGTAGAGKGALGFGSPAANMAVPPQDCAAKCRANWSWACVMSRAP